MTNDIKVGDVVRLASGGPEMTANRKSGGVYGGAPNFEFMWFDGYDLHEVILSADAVKVVDGA